MDIVITDVDKLVAEALGVPELLENRYEPGRYLDLRDALRMVGCELTDADLRYAAECGIRKYVDGYAPFVRRQLKERLPDYS